MRRWNPFGGTQSTPAPPAPPAVDPPLVVTPPDAKYFGLENFGNTCYANSVLQALYFCGPFRELILQYPDPSVPELPPALPQPVSPSPTPRPKPTRKLSTSDPHPALITSNHAAGSNQSASAGTNSSTPGIIPIPPSPPTLLSALRSLYIHISRHPADRGTVAPRAFIDKVKELNELFRPSQHQDAHEFLNFLLNKIVEEMDDDRRNGIHVHSGVGTPREDLSQSISSLNPPASTATNSTTHPLPSSSTIVHRLFEGILTSETRCLTCETVSSRDESFLDLSIDIEQNSSVTACLKQFSASEMLCHKNKFFCDSCCDLQEAEKRMKIKKLPNVLALHLKRFKYQEDTGRYVKLTYRVAFPFHLRLFNTVDDAENPDRLYELFAIVVHIGAGPHHGHYVSIIKARGTWYLFDDDNVDTIKESEITKYYGDNNGSAYVLYYQATDLDVAALGLRLPQPVTTTSRQQEAPTPQDPPSSAQSIALSVATSSEEANLPTLPPGLMPPVPEGAPDPTPAVLDISSPALSVSIPPNAPESGPSTPTALASPSTLNTLFKSLRHSPSGKIRKHTLDAVKSDPPPPLPASPTCHPDPPTTVSSVTDTSESSHIPPPTPNGKEKEKEPERKASGWLRRRSIREDKKDDSGNPVNWLKHAGRLGRRPSEAGLHGSGSLSTPSSPRVPPPSTFNSSTTHSPPEHKKSVPELSLLNGNVKGKRRLPQRPSTAGASVGSSSSHRPHSAVVPPLPPLPGSPTHVNGHQEHPRSSTSTSHNETSLSPSPRESTHRERGHTANGSAVPSFEVRRMPRPQSSSSAMMPGLGFGSSSNGTSFSGDAGHAPLKKRTSRKLSFTAPILGFGRRDKDREKEKEKTSSPPPTSFYSDGSGLHFA